MFDFTKAQKIAFPVLILMVLLMWLLTWVYGYIYFTGQVTSWVNLLVLAWCSFWSVYGAWHIVRIIRRYWVRR